MDVLCLQDAILRQQPTIHVQDQPRRSVEVISLLSTNQRAVVNTDLDQKDRQTSTTLL